MNPFVFAFLLTVSQAVAVAAEGKESKSTSKKSIPLIVGIIVAVVVGMRMPCYHCILPFSQEFPVLIIAALIILIRKRSRKSKRMSASVQPQNAPHLNGGQAAGYGKDSYSPYVLTLVRTYTFSSSTTMTLTHRDIAHTTLIYPGGVESRRSPIPIQLDSVFPSASRPNSRMKQNTIDEMGCCSGMQACPSFFVVRNCWDTNSMYFVIPVYPNNVTNVFRLNRRRAFGRPWITRVVVACLANRPSGSRDRH